MPWEFRVSLCGPTIVKTVPPTSLQVVKIDSRIPRYLPGCRISDDRKDNSDFNFRNLAGIKLHILNLEAIGPLLKCGGLLRLSRELSYCLSDQVPWGLAHKCWEGGADDFGWHLLQCRHLHKPLKKELSSKAKLSIYRFGPNLTIICDLDCWVAIARRGIRILVVKQGFFLESGWWGALDGEDNVTRAAAHRHSSCFDIQNATPWRCSRNVPLDEGPGLTEGIAYPTWPEDTLGRRPGTP